MKWQDIDDVVHALEEAHPRYNAAKVSFVELRKFVMALPGFVGDPDRCNERTLEAIQMAWIELQEESASR
jgi:FeS assembly protein IscX